MKDNEILRFIWRFMDRKHILVILWLVTENKKKLYNFYDKMYGSSLYF